MTEADSAALPTSPGSTAQPARVAGCALCDDSGGLVVWSSAEWRVVRVADAGFPAFYRLISNHHVREFSDLLAPERARCMGLVCAIERVLLDLLQPAKVNLASLGNSVAHLHWHVVARFSWDSCFPQSVWSAPQRDAPADAEQRLGVALSELDAAVASALQAG